MWNQLNAAANADDDDPIYIHCEKTATPPTRPPGNYFRDGQTKIGDLLSLHS